MEKSFQTLIDGNEILRTTFFETDSGVIQRIHPRHDFKLSVISPETAAAGKSDRFSDNAIEEESRLPFNLESGPLFRAKLIRKGDDNFLLLLVFHHSIMDSYSRQIFAHELEDTYNSEVSGYPPKTVDTAAQYALYSQRQQALLGTDEVKKKITEISRDLEGQSGILNWKTDYVRPLSSSFAGSRISFECGADLSENIRKMSTRDSFGNLSVLLSAYIILLYKYSNQKDITIGFPVSDRDDNSFKDSLGCFVNILPIGFEISSNTTFKDLLEAVRQKLKSVENYKDVPFEEIVKSVQPKHLPGANPIFQVGFSVEPPMMLRLKDLEITPMDVHSHGAQLDLFLSLTNIDHLVRGHIEYDVQLFSKNTIHRFSVHYLNILKSASENSGIRIGDLEILTTDEKTRLIHDLNDTAMPIPSGVCLHHLFEQEVLRTPGSVAITCAGTMLTYEQLNKRANRLAGYLVHLGVTQNTIVGINLERSVDMLVAVLGVLKSGGTYVPLDPAFPPNRLNYIVEDTALRFLITEVGSTIDATGLETIYFERDEEKIGQFGDEFTSSAADPDSLAYVLYTSGSTGKPKGIGIHHKAVVNFILSMQKEPGIASTDALLAVTTLSFDISILELLLPLSVGAKIILASRQDASNGQSLLSLLRSSGATMMQATPSTWQILIAAGLRERRKLKILCGGESLTDSLASDLCKISDDVWNMYGPTETTIWSTCAKVEPNRPVTIGRPIANTQIYIVDDALHLTPPGVPGELLIGGDGVSRGYINRPELTAERFVTDEFTGRTEYRLYRTGDLACYHPGGGVEILGRKDYQVKIRGFRIELGEIENVLSRHPGIEQCAVVVYERTKEDKRLIAYIKTIEGYRFNAAETREFMRADLPDYMIPSAFQILEKMPLTDNGKIARDKLPSPVLETEDSQPDEALPKREIERKILAIWQKAIGAGGIGIHDNFFDVGGSSLIAIRVAEDLKRELGRNVPVVLIFQYPTIEKLASHIEGTAVENRLLADAIKRAQRFRKGRFVGDPLKDGIAVIGMAGRFPGASNLDQLWENLCNGVESISRFSLDELGPGIDEKTKNDPDYVPCRGIIEDADKFDAKFFDIGPLEAKLMDPQHRIFLELAWSALENAGYKMFFVIPNSYKLWEEPLSATAMKKTISPPVLPMRSTSPDRESAPIPAVQAPYWQLTTPLGLSSIMSVTWHSPAGWIYAFLRKAARCTRKVELSPRTGIAARLTPKPPVRCFVTERALLYCDDWKMPLRPVIRSTLSCGVPQKTTTAQIR